jgi:hypothetical protein
LRLPDIRGSGAVHRQLARRQQERPRAADRSSRGFGRFVPATKGEHIGAASDFAADQPALSQCRVSASYRADCHPKIEGEIALRRELGSGGKHAALDVALDTVG